MTDRNARTDNVSDLIASQVNFGLAYLQEARTAYDQGRYEYGDLARQIALNAYSTATRFAAWLPEEPNAALLSRVARFKAEVEGMLDKTVAVPSIA
jgi:hypothetical protein